MQKLKYEQTKYSFKRIILYVFLFLLLIIYLPTTIWHFPDGIGYYSYLPAIFKYGNYDFYSIFKSFTPGIIGITHKGFVVNDFDIGYSFICWPVYLFSMIYESETFSIMITNFFSSLLGLVSLFILYKFLVENLFLEKKYSMLICLCTLIGTPLLFYSYSVPQNPHTVAAFLCSIYLYFVLTLSEKNETFYTYSLLGVLLGIISSVRMQRIILALPLLINLFIKMLKPMYFKKYILLLLTFFVSFIVGLSPQLINSTIQFGTPLPPKIYTLHVNKYLLLLIYETLFSSYHSIILWTPLIFISFIGLFILLKINWLFSVKLLSVIILEILTVSLVISPGGGASFGIRYLTDIIFIVGVGLYFLVKLSSNKTRIFVITIMLMCSLWSFILFILSTNNKIDLLKVYHIRDFITKIFVELKYLNLTLKPRYIPDTDVYLLLTFILLIIIFISTKYNRIINTFVCKWIFIILILSLTIFDGYLLSAGVLNRVVYKEEIYKRSLTLSEYQKFYTLAGLKIRLKYYRLTKQKEKFDYYLTLRDKFWPKTYLGKYYADILYSDFYYENN
ncbi:MAG: glycosyltransferase family 39 protein [Endomicrobia bacterium]|nr:glycosyltransferase family 39 protein [Endomicrobiia bacterium]